MNEKPSVRVVRDSRRWILRRNDDLSNQIENEGEDAKVDE
jgi:hypothetical protein